MAVFNCPATTFRLQNLHLLHIIVSIFLISSIPVVISSSFKFSKFDPNNDKDIEYHGDASPSMSGIQLTNNEQTQSMQNSIGRAVFKIPMQLTDFTTNFSFIVNSQGNSSYGDGISFFLAGENFRIPNRSGSGSGSGGLGLVNGNDALNSTERFVAVEFDTHTNSWDPAYVHVGINVNSMKSSIVERWCSDIENGTLSNATVSYSRITKLLRVEFSGFCSGTTSIQHPVDLTTVLPKNIVVGMSAETSNLVEIHTLKSWNFLDLSPGDAKNTGLVVSLSLFLCILFGELCLMWIGLYWKKSH